MHSIRLIKSIATLLWTLATVTLLAEASPSEDSRLSKTGRVGEETQIHPRQQQQCAAGPDNVGATFQDPISDGLTPGKEATCTALLKFLETGGKSKNITPGKNGICMPDIKNPECCIDWKNNKGEMALVRFDDLVAPLKVALSQGTKDGGTRGSLKSYLLAACTDIFVSKNGQFPAS